MRTDYKSQVIKELRNTGIGLLGGICISIFCAFWFFMRNEDLKQQCGIAESFYSFMGSWERIKYAEDL